ncbi:MAG: type VI secretion system contractile sheath large subunit [Byssovorax sp.]
MAESKQHWLDRNRPPRVQITYDVETLGAIEKRELPLVVGVMSDLSGADTGGVNPEPKLKARKFVEIDRDNFNKVLKTMKPQVEGGAGANKFKLLFEAMEDFHPNSLVKKDKELEKLIAQRTALIEIPVKLDGNESLAGQLVSTTDEAGRKALEDGIAELDTQIGERLDTILHDPNFQKLEARWRGLHYLVTNTETSTHLKIRVLNASMDDLITDFETAPEFDRSVLFKKVYEEEYGILGGAPFSMLVGDYYFSGSSPHINLLTRLSNVAAAAHAPFLSAPAPALFDMGSWDDLAVPGDLAKLFEGSLLIQWREFRETEDSRYVSLALPRVLLRLPYSQENNPVKNFIYDENVYDAEALRYTSESDVLLKRDEAGKFLTENNASPGEGVVPLKEGGRFIQVRTGEKPNAFLLGNAAYALAQRVTNAFALHRWCAAIRGVEGGGLVENLPVHTFETSDHEIAVNCPTEVAITDRRENELSKLGFLALCYKKGSGQAAFFGSSTTNKPKEYFLPAASANAILSAQLPYILTTSRFAHYLKVIVRDKIGSFAAMANVQSFLNNWIGDYVLLADSAGQETKARYPLREARVDVTEVPGKPGVYKAVAYLRPHFQLNELTISLRLVAELPAAAG